MNIEWRIEKAEKVAGMGGKYVSIPLPGNEGHSMRLPRAFAEWMAKAGREDCAGGRYFNYTDGKWVEKDDDDRT